MATEATQGTVEFLGMYEAEAPDVRWSGHANDDSVLVLVKTGAFPGEHLVLWYVAREWSRVDGSHRQWMFEWSAERSERFGVYTDEDEAIAAAKAALVKHCGKEWS